VHLTFIKTLPQSSPSPSNDVVLQIKFAFSPAPNVVYTDTMSQVISVNTPQPLFSVDITLDGPEPLKVCEPHDVLVCVKRNPMVSEAQAQERLHDFRRNGLIERIDPSQEEGIVVGLGTSDSTWQLLGLRSVVMSPLPIVDGQLWRRVFRLLPLRTGYTSLPVLRPSHMLAARDVFSSTHCTVNVLPESTYLLTLLRSEDGALNTPSKKGMVMSQRVIFHNESSSRILMQAQERRAFKLVSGRADLVICWFDSGSLATNPAGPIFKDTVDKMAARNVNIQVNVVSEMEHLLAWMRYTGSEFLRNISTQGKLRIIVSYDSQKYDDDPEALNVLLCLSQTPVLAATPIFVQCKKPPASIANLDNVVFVTDPRRLVSMVTVAAKQPELFSPSVLRKSLRPAEELVSSLIEKESKGGSKLVLPPVTVSPPPAAAAAAAEETEAPSVKPEETKDEKTPPVTTKTPPLTVTDEKGEKLEVTATPLRQPKSPRQSLPLPQYPPPHPPESTGKGNENANDSDSDKKEKGSESS